MISVEYNDNSIYVNSQWIPFSDIRIEDENVTSIFLTNDLNCGWYSFLANETTINDVLQTSAQMIYDTLTSNV